MCLIQEKMKWNENCVECRTRKKKKRHKKILENGNKWKNCRENKWKNYPQKIVVIPSKLSVILVNIIVSSDGVGCVEYRK